MQNLTIIIRNIHTYICYIYVWCVYTHVQLILHIHGFHMHGFNESWLRNIKKKFFRNFQRTKLDLPCAVNYLHGIYSVLGNINNLKMVQGTWEDVYMLHANNIPFYIRDWSIFTFWCPQGSPETITRRYQGTTVCVRMCVCVRNKTILGYFYRDNNWKSSLRKSTH